MPKKVKLLAPQWSGFRVQPMKGDAPKVLSMMGYAKLPKDEGLLNNSLALLCSDGQLHDGSQDSAEASVYLLACAELLCNKQVGANSKVRRRFERLKALYEASLGLMVWTDAALLFAANRSTPELEHFIQRAALELKGVTKKSIKDTDTYRFWSSDIVDLCEFVRRVKDVLIQEIARRLTFAMTQGGVSTDHFYDGVAAIAAAGGTSVGGQRLMKPFFVRRDTFTATQFAAMVDFLCRHTTKNKVASALTKVFSISKEGAIQWPACLPKNKDGSVMSVSLWFVTEKSRQAKKAWYTRRPRLTRFFTLERLHTTHQINHLTQELVGASFEMPSFDATSQHRARITAVRSLVENEMKAVKKARFGLLPGFHRQSRAALNAYQAQLNTLLSDTLMHEDIRALRVLIDIIEKKGELSAYQHKMLPIEVQRLRRLAENPAHQNHLDALLDKLAELEKRYWPNEGSCDAQVFQALTRNHLPKKDALKVACLRYGLLKNAASVDARFQVEQSFPGVVSLFHRVVDDARSYFATVYPEVYSSTLEQFIVNIEALNLTQESTLLNEVREIVLELLCKNFSQASTLKAMQYAAQAARVLPALFPRAASSYNVELIDGVSAVALNKESGALETLNALLLTYRCSASMRVFIDKLEVRCRERLNSEYDEPFANHVFESVERAPLSRRGEPKIADAHAHTVYFGDTQAAKWLRAYRAISEMAKSNETISPLLFERAKEVLNQHQLGDEKNSLFSDDCPTSTSSLPRSTL